MAVTENAEGAKVDTEEQVKDAKNQLIASTVEAGTPDDASKVSPKEEEKLYSQKQLDDFVHMAESKAGRDRVTLEKERDEAKSNLEKQEGEVADIQDERDRVQKQLEELTSDDPKKFDLVKKDKELRDSERLLKKGVDTLASEKKVHEETVKTASDTMREISIWEVAAAHQSGDPVKLKDLCDTFGATTEEQIQKVAETIWAKKDGTKESSSEAKTTGEKKEELVLDSGDTSGGGGEKTEQEKLKARYHTMFPK